MAKYNYTEVTPTDVRKSFQMAADKQLQAKEQQMLKFFLNHSDKKKKKNTTLTQVQIATYFEVIERLLQDENQGEQRAI